MGRRPSGALPTMRRHKATNTARIVLAGKVHSLGRWGSTEAQDRYDTLMAAYIASGRTSLDAGRAVIGRPAPTPEPPPAPSSKDATGGLTVGELARAWLADIEATRPDCRRTSLWHGAVAASRAVRPFATMPVAANDQAGVDPTTMLATSSLEAFRVPPQKKTPPLSATFTGSPAAFAAWKVTVFATSDDPESKIRAREVIVAKFALPFRIRTSTPSSMVSVTNFRTWTSPSIR